MLKRIKETYEIQKEGDTAYGLQDGEKVELSLESVVSMNMWGVYPEFFGILENGFHEFLEQLPDNEMKKEYLLPTIIGDLLNQNKAEVRILKSEDQWFGVTYQEDKDYVISSVRKLVDDGVYPASLY
jgi:hypothetical protein